MSQRSKCIVIGTALALLMLRPGLAQDSKSTPEATYQDIQRTLGSVPGFFRQFPESGQRWCLV